MLRRGLAAAAAALLFPVFLVATAAPAQAGGPRCIPSDFNGDGHADIAAGAPQATVDGLLEAGAFRVVYGRDNGVATSGTDQYFNQDTPGFPGTPAKFGRFGQGLAAGFFNSDCYADLAVVDGDSSGASDIVVLYGSSTGLTTAGMAVLLPGSGRWFGNATSVGDFNNDGYDDLADGSPDMPDAGMANSGALGIMYGSAAGLQPPAQWMVLGDSHVPGVAQAGAHFGGAVAAGDLDGDGLDDLAVAAPDYTVRPAVHQGMVVVVFGSSTGLTEAGSQAITRTSTGMPPTTGYHAFGFSLATGRGSGDRSADLTIGVPGETINGLDSAGAVVYLPGSATGPTTAGSVLLSQATPGIPGGAESGDEFGFSVAMGDFDADSHADLAIGTPYETIGQDLDAAGTVTVVPNSGTGPVPGAAVLWQDATGGCGPDQFEDDYGRALYAANIKSPLYKDLVIGDPGISIDGLASNGALDVLYGSSSGLTATGSQCFGEPGDHVPPADEDNWGWAIA
jgi:hypothetical protein